MEIILISLQPDVRSEKFVILRNITRESAGSYKCQVSAEGPMFVSEAQSKQLRVAGKIVLNDVQKLKFQTLRKESKALWFK